MINFVADRVWNASFSEPDSKEFKTLKDMTSLAVSPFYWFLFNAGSVGKREGGRWGRGRGVWGKEKG